MTTEALGSVVRYPGLEELITSARGRGMLGIGAPGRYVPPKSTRELETERGGRAKTLRLVVEADKVTIRRVIRLG